MVFREIFKIKLKQNEKKLLKAEVKDVNQSR